LALTGTVKEWAIEDTMVAIWGQLYLWLSLVTEFGLILTNVFDERPIFLAKEIGTKVSLSSGFLRTTQVQV
jgi:hypothetical protein